MTYDVANSSAGRRQELRVVLSSSAQLVTFRQQLRGLLAARHVTEAEREAIVLAAVEALDNALLACERCERSDCQVEVVVSLIADYVCVEVRDAGAGTKGACLDLAKLAGESAEHGRGLYLMRELMESLELVSRSQGTLVRMMKRLPGRESRDDPTDAGRLAS
jgi:anti-sigma regulatory factor (Ser/Thr protein kinase)